MHLANDAGAMSPSILHICCGSSFHPVPYLFFVTLSATRCVDGHLLSQFLTRLGSEMDRTGILDLGVLLHWFPLSTHWDLAVCNGLRLCRTMTVFLRHQLRVVLAFR